MSETDPGYSEQYAGNVGARRATVGTPTERESINVPPTRPGAAENARRVEEERTAHETFAPEPVIPDERAQALESEWAQAESPRHHSAHHSAHHSSTHHTPRTAPGTGHHEESNVRKEIEETRRELGETVGALAAKADVKARAAHVAETAKDRAAGMAGSVKEMATEVAGKVREGTPHQVKDAAGQARKRPMLLVAAAGAVLAFVVRRMMMRRNRRPRR
ncbi:DUF3618 domain-containing protein [Nonomuraea angiospora]|uniref:DUF3618 domain-containing protein n=1 Tax=Nonomuraea angiospora TaxID=46172 RepID=A0ABR9LY22_9ACTN|nr:DUF3618 domain-containing protein [Nonomuraea angiospora]MBE1585532.1 hypothetical protein [Nonomuraea angiospora]